jgi:predicted RNA-binding Zn-ribbon protein involved in translation (DUF1610 family)
MPDSSAGRDVADGGTDTEPIDWPFAAVVHGASVDADCLALTGSGKPCSYNAYQSNDLPVCNTHERVDDPDIVAGAHQWARITDGEQGTVTVCVACEAVWRGDEPETLVACPECSADAGERCRDESSMHSAPIPPHPDRRQRAYGVVEHLEPCPATVTGVADEDQEVVADGGVTEIPSADSPATRLRESYKQTRLARAGLDEGSPEAAYLRQALAHIESALVLIEGPDVLDELGENSPEAGGDANV